MQKISSQKISEMSELDMQQAQRTSKSKNNVPLFPQSEVQQRSADEIAEDLIHNFGCKYDNAKAKAAIYEINKDNVARVWAKYSKFINDTPTKKSTNLAAQIYDHFDAKEARKMLNHLMVCARDAAIEQGIDVGEDIDNYNKAWNETYYFFASSRRRYPVCEAVRTLVKKLPQ